ncbi:flavin reductase family protein [Streptomyces sp. NPDC096311]|uniref:flavin reductase family protein n=1 Tax=Streptomyces sp. NPDC096311 TaxID=3366083 RepID=UPI00381C85E2
MKTDASTSLDVQVTALKDRFREAMARVPAAVAVVTSIDEEGAHGTTVTAFTSLSVSPPMVLVSLDNNSTLLSIIRRTGRFGLNVLSAEQASLATTFAGKGRGKFAGIEWTLDHEVPRIPETIGWLACELADLIPGGDHHIALGNVLNVEPGGTSDSLTYQLRTFGTHAGFPTSA